MKLFWKYIKQYRFSALMFCIFSAVFAIVFSLYDLQTEAVLYACIICAVVALTVLTVHFIFFCRKYNERRQLIDNITLMTEALPEAGAPLEEQYIEMLERLREVCYENQSRYDRERTDSIDYFTTWVHQIKTPISVMQMILQSEDTEEYRTLSAELFRIEQYAEMALSWFRLDSKSNDFVIEQIPLDKVIRTAIRKYAPQLIRKKIKIVYGGTDLTAISDEKWLLFIIEQLLSNAVKYIESGSISIDVTEQKVLKICDTGIGIAPEDLPRIFEKGYTGYNGRADKKSTGLGLYLSRKAADKLSHRIFAQSQVGKGSTFYIDLNADNIEIE